MTAHENEKAERFADWLANEINEQVNELSDPDLLSPENDPIGANLERRHIMLDMLTAFGFWRAGVMRADDFVSLCEEDGKSLDEWKRKVDEYYGTDRGTP